MDKCMPDLGGVACGARQPLVCQGQKLAPGNQLPTGTQVFGFWEFNYNMSWYGFLWADPL